ncbi:MAG: isoprenyl transferase [Elusimicrobia bacterium]|nr:isoprenyl transferase [Elusimicrobiota bacterium]MDY5728650.1 isoprenyl transferase [Elusimicrobiaceae bacterium]
MSETHPNSTPKHVAIIMDGNGRWAQERHLPRLAGHNAGAKAVERTLKAAKQADIKFLTLYAFSTENWIRPQDEIAGLFKLLEQTLDRYTQDAAKHNVRLVISGERDRLPARILEKMDRAVSSTAANTGLTLNLALNYGARQEILHAVKALLQSGQKNISLSDLSAHLYHPEIPDPELIIRTSGEERLSNFLLWQAAYSEFYFTPVLWPDFDEAEFNKALAAYAHRTRRFGGV